jgi:rfaE bifunctional protein nucleotidyltransferase chain/domain
MTNGCFDLLHPGHLSSLEFARRQGDCLIVAINSDRSTTVLKGAGHPIVDECGRAKLLAGLICVDYVVVFDDVSVASTVERLHPDVLVKSGEYALDQVVGHEIVQQYGGQVLLAPMQPGYSTTAIIDRIRGCTDPGNTTRGR